MGRKRERKLRRKITDLQVAAANLLDSNVRFIRTIIEVARERTQAEEQALLAHEYIEALEEYEEVVYGRPVPFASAFSVSTKTGR